MTEPVQLREAPPDDETRVALLEHLADVKLRVESGETIGLLVIEENKVAFSMGRTRMKLESAVSFLSRTLYMLHREWDRFMGLS